MAPARSVRRRASARPATRSTVSISPCASSTWRRPPRAGPPRRRACAEDGARLADAVERIRWRLWHGQVPRALDLISETLAWLAAKAETAPAAATKVVALLRGL